MCTKRLIVRIRFIKKREKFHTNNSPSWASQFNDASAASDYHFMWKVMTTKNYPNLLSCLLERVHGKAAKLNLIHFVLQKEAKSGRLLQQSDHFQG